MSQIKKVYMVSCGICMCEEPMYQSKNLPELAAELIGYGWKKTKENGWICPECLEEDDEGRNNW